jgi:hypothetical protein
VPGPAGNCAYEHRFATLILLRKEISWKEKVSDNEFYALSVRRSGCLSISEQESVARMEVRFNVMVYRQPATRVIESGGGSRGKATWRGVIRLDRMQVLQDILQEL